MHTEVLGELRVVNEQMYFVKQDWLQLISISYTFTSSLTIDQLKIKLKDINLNKQGTV